MNKIFLIIVTLLTGSTSYSYNLFQFFPNKTLASCTGTSDKIVQVSSDFSYCQNTNAVLSATSMSFINCNSAVYAKINTLSPACSTAMTGYTKVGPTGSVYIKIHGDAGPTGHDMNVLGPQQSYYFELDNENTGAMNDTQLVAYTTARLQTCTAAKNCLLNMRKTDAAKCVIKTDGTVSQ